MYSARCQRRRSRRGEQEGLPRPDGDAARRHQPPHDDHAGRPHGHQREDHHGSNLTFAAISAVNEVITAR